MAEFIELPVLCITRKSSRGKPQEVQWLRRNLSWGTPLRLGPRYSLAMTGVPPPPQESTLDQRPVKEPVTG